MDWIPRERRKRGRPRKTWMERVHAAVTTRNLEPDQRRNREERRLVSGRRRQLLKNRTSRKILRRRSHVWQAKCFLHSDRKLARRHFGENEFNDNEF